MSNPTSNFGWQMPTPTDLVTDLPADFEVFGQAVDTDLADLKGGTTGQILSKTSATDLDFTWINNDQGDITGVTAGTGISGGGTSGTVTVTNSMATAIDAKGDLIAGTGADAFSRLAVGANNTVLTADSAEATGLKWVAPAGGGKVLQVIQGTTSTQVNIAGQTYAQSGIEATITPSAASSKILILATCSTRSNRTSSNTQSKAQIRRGTGTVIQDYITTFMGIEPNSSGYLAINMTRAISYLDSPSTTSATTYYIYGTGAEASDTISFQMNSAPSSIILMEIGA